MKKEVKEIINELKTSKTNRVKLAITDIDGILRGKVVSMDKFLSIVENGFGFCDVVFGWDSADVAYDNARYTGWHTGYPDAQVKLDLTTMRKIPWDNDLPLVLGDFTDNEGSSLSILSQKFIKKHY